MSLKVWLPLNGDLRNNGTINLDIVNNKAVIDASGKIGKCYQFNGSDSFISLTSSELYTILNGSGQPFSVAMWAYHSDSTRAILFGDYSVSGGNNFNIELTTGHALRWYWGTPDINISAMNIDVNVWHHIAFTYSGTVLKGYIDGIEKYTNTITLSAKNRSSGPYYLGRDGRTGITAFNGRLNDFRIYDHCLSPLEVKEISQGLVLHYKLDSKYIENTTNLYSGTFSNTCYNGATNKYGYGTNTDIYKTTGFFQGKNSVKIYMGTAGLDAYPYVYFDAFGTTGTNIHTLSFDYYPTTQTSIIPYSYNGAYNISYITSNGDSNTLTNTSQTTIPVIVNQWNHISITMQKYDTTNTTRGNGYIRIGSAKHTSTTTDYWLFANIQVEAKDHETGYTDPGTTRNNTVIQDSSGYNNNGIILNSIQIANKTPRYSISANLTAGNSAINCGKGGKVTDSITVNLWIKTSAWANPVSCTESGGWNFESSGDYFRFPVFVSGVGYKYGVSSTTRAQICNNQWHMLTGIYDRLNGHIKIYVDGELDNDYDAGITNVIRYNGSNVIWLGAEASGSDTAFASNGMTGLFSDFRIYATALLDTDIKMLYNTAMKIDNLNNIHTYKLDEKGRELLNGIPLTAYFATHSTTSSIFNGEAKMTGRGSLGSDYIKINPIGHTYYYDIIYSCATGNQFYIGFERYDASKTARSNHACVYIVMVKPTTDQVKVHVKGAVNLQTDGVNPTDTIALRVLNGWDGSNSSSAKTMTIHYMSLREVATNQEPQVLKSGEFVVEELREYNDAKFYQNGMIETTEIIEM